MQPPTLFDRYADLSNGHDPNQNAKITNHGPNPNNSKNSNPVFRLVASHNKS